MPSELAKHVPQNITQGKRILTVERLLSLASERRAVSFAGWDRPKPAAFLVGMTVRTVLQFIDRGLYEYQKETKHNGRIGKV